ncbi:hypothetical protein V1639_06225 [Pseudarthrobacter sp. J75]|uniref:hypothetical protein n=1 Tax=unclassified Pseudarthrobacter TaxID=2647000 RepID=UPI002E7FB59A|nr:MULTISPECIES: hypothetical protein [unclassified Pseudarthrobacter]MEE2521394.1 hypothetical protein [Pseudarthrobacter sp. J47]MEE2528626.1 hypothetical protein [Pseudarthrobacter sp. J75]MEE2568317.1 hypothetical protein [Pseudarthrobacter sp. J64]
MALRLMGMAEGPWVPPLLFLLLFALPTARTLSGRIAISLAAFFGLTPLLWWIPSGFGPIGRGTVILAALAAAVAWFLFRERTLMAGLKSLVPRAGLLDILPVGAAAVSCWVHFNLLTVRTFEQAMSLLTMNWDNASHFTIFHMLRIHGRVIALMGPAPDGSSWSFQDYPQGFHGVVATLTELSSSKRAGDASTEIVNYANGSALVSVLVVAMVAASLAALPALRRHPTFAAPAIALMAAGWVFGPGASASLNGFPNFFLAAGLASVAMVMAVSMDRFFRIPVLLATLGCVVGVAHNWVLLEVLVLGAVVVVLLPWRKGLWRASTGEYRSAAALVALAVAGLVLALVQLSGVSTDAVLYGIGGVPIPDIGQLLAVLLVGGAVFTLAFLNRGRNTLSVDVKLRWSFLGVALALLVAISMAAAQLAKGGTVTYYTHKLGIAIFLAGLVVLCLALAALLGHAGKHQVADRRRGLIAGAVLASLAATQVFGFTFPLKNEGLPPTAPAAVAMSKELQALEKTPKAVHALMAAVNNNGGQQAVYVTTEPAEIDAILAKQWYDGLTATYTEAGWRLSLNMFELSAGVDSLRAVVTKIMKEDPSARIIVDPENQATLDYILATLDG